MKQDPKTEPYSSEPSGFTIENDDLVAPQFSDITEIYVSDTHFLCKGIRYGRIWIIKGLNPTYRCNEACREMLKKEFDIMMRLKHESIVQGSSFEELPSLGSCIIMEYIDGATLGEWLSSNPSLSSRLRIAREMITTLDYVHSQGIVHRDIKLENLLVTRLGNRLKIIDFGLSDSDDYAVFKHPAGTKGYVSPEQQSSSVPDVRNDIFSVGKILENLLPERRFAKTRELCTGPIDKRPSDLQALTVKLGKDASKPSRLRVMAIIALVSIIVFGCAFMAYKTGERSTKVDATSHILTDSASLPLNPMQSPDLKDSASVSALPHTEQAANVSERKHDATDEVKPITPTTPKINVNEIISKGSARIDNLWNRTAMLYLDTLRNLDKMTYDWSTAGMEKIRDEILSEHSNDLSTDEKQLVKERLNLRIQENYNKWNRQRLQKM